MNIPNFLVGYNDDYHQDLNQEMRDNLSIYFVIPKLTTSQVNIIIDRDYSPRVPAGALWFNTNLQKWQGVVTEAVSGVSDAVIETITST